MFLLKKNLCYLLLVFLLMTEVINFQAYASIQVTWKSKTLEAPFAKKYQWFFYGKLILTETGRSIKVKRPGIYEVKLESFDGKIQKSRVLIKMEGEKIIRIYLVGDSTMQDYSIRPDYETNYFPMTGWGEKIQSFLHSDSLYKVKNIIDADSVIVINKARGGRSTRSFWEEGSWQDIQDLLQPGNYVFIQFGHNDEANCEDYPERCASITEYKEFLYRYVDSTRSKGAIPILITPINRDYPWSKGIISNVHGLYPDAMKEVARNRKVPLIDGTQRSLDLFNEKGQEYTTYHYFMVFDAGTYPNYKVTTEFPNGSPRNDRTHFQAEGALEVARIVYEGLQDLSNAGCIPNADTVGINNDTGWYKKRINK